MTNESTLRFKKLFEQQRNELLFSKSIVDETFHIQREEMHDDADLTSLERETSMRMRLRNREALFIKKIDEALRRIAEGSFGSCEECSEDIELKRLEARPTATLCVNCKEEQERRETGHIDGHRHKSLGRQLRLA